MPATDPLAGFLRLLEQDEGGRSAGEGIAIVVAHPDDETIGIGGHLRRLNGLTIVHVTDGAPRDLADARLHGFADWQGYAAARRRELESAMAEAGLAPHCLLSLGYPDKQVAWHLVGLAQRLAAFLAEAGPDYVCTHPFEGGHPDHDATAFAVHAACVLLRQAGEEQPFLIEMAFYHAGADGPVFQDFCAYPPVPHAEIHLGRAACERKRRMLACFETQRRVLAPFDPCRERFRVAPAYDFCALPNCGRLHYETLPVGFSGSDWLRLARAAADALELEPLRC